MEEILELYQELRSLFGENDFGADLCQQIHRIVQETIDQIPDGTRIAIRPAGKDTRKLLELYEFNGKNIIGIVNRRNREDGFCGYPCYTTDSFSAKMCDCVIIFSFYYRQEFKEELEKLHVPYIDLYDELEKWGIRLRVPYHFYESTPHVVVNYYYLRYQQSEAGSQREIALNALLQVAVEYKDFALISSIYQDCGGENGEFSLLRDVWRKSKQLLDCLQNKLQERKQKDIVIFWTDAVPYDLLHCLPETMELSKQGTFFQRAYTHTPYTEATMHSLFCNTLPIDDFPQYWEKIESRNSPLLQFLENEGYKVRVVGSLGLSMGKEHLIEINSQQPCNIKWWEGILDLLQSPEPCFYIFYFMESHEPCFVPVLEEPFDIKGPYEIASSELQRQRDIQVRTALGYLDQCLNVFHELLGNKTQVFLSDHGIYFDGDGYWMEQRLHSYCFVVGENMPKTTVTRFFPYRNFEKFIRWLVDSAHFSLDDICMDEVIFQDIDFYNPILIDYVIRIGNAKIGVSYRGVLNYNYKYVINALGEEYFYQMQPDGSEKLVPLKDPALRNELRGKAGTKFLDIYQYDEFRHSRRLYDYIKSTES